MTHSIHPSRIKIPEYAAEKWCFHLPLGWVLYAIPKYPARFYLIADDSVFSRDNEKMWLDNCEIKRKEKLTRKNIFFPSGRNIKNGRSIHSYMYIHVHTYIYIHVHYIHCKTPFLPVVYCLTQRWRLVWHFGKATAECSIAFDLLPIKHCLNWSLWVSNSF